MIQKFDEIYLKLNKRRLKIKFTSTLKNDFVKTIFLVYFNKYKFSNVLVVGNLMAILTK